MSFPGSTEWMQVWRNSDCWRQTVPCPGGSDKKRSVAQWRPSSRWYDERWRTRWSQSQTLPGLHSSDLLKLVGHVGWCQTMLTLAQSPINRILKRDLVVKCMIKTFIGLPYFCNDKCKRYTPTPPPPIYFCLEPRLVKDTGIAITDQKACAKRYHITQLGHVVIAALSNERSIAIT